MFTRALSCILPILLIAGCGGTPDKGAGDADAVPEITLNLPQTDCACTEPSQDYTFLEKGFLALEDDQYLEALQYFQRYQRIEKSPRANVEARIAIAYLSILPDSPIYDRVAARESYSALRPRITRSMELHDKVLLMKGSLDVFLELDEQVERLKESNSSLRSELDKREEALKRLRDLTLGREPEPVGLLGK